MKVSLLASLLMGFAPITTASFNSTKDIYCQRQPEGTCTLTLHLGASADKLQSYWNRLARVKTSGAGNHTHAAANKTSHDYHTHSNTSEPKMVLSGSYDAILKFLAEEAHALQKKRGVTTRHRFIRHEHDTARYANASSFIGDVAMIHDHNCNPLSHLPTTNLSDSTSISSTLKSPLTFKLYQPGSTTGHLDANFEFEYGNKKYKDCIGTDAGRPRGDDHPCTCYASSKHCPDGSERCCSCRFSCGSGSAGDSYDY